MCSLERKPQRLWLLRRPPPHQTNEFPPKLIPPKLLSRQHPASCLSLLKLEKMKSAPDLVLFTSFLNIPL